MVTDWWALKEAAEPSPFLIAAATHSGKRQRESESKDEGEFVEAKKA